MQSRNVFLAIRALAEVDHLSSPSFAAYGRLMGRDTHQWSQASLPASMLVDGADSLSRPSTSSKGDHHAALRCNVLRDRTDRGSSRIQWGGRNVGPDRLVLRGPGSDRT